VWDVTGKEQIAFYLYEVWDGALDNVLDLMHDLHAHGHCVLLVPVDHIDPIHWPTLNTVKRKME